MGVYGIDNWALTKDQALRAIDDLEARGIPVLGGDVVEMTGDGPEYTYDNWYSNRDSGKAMGSFVTHSAGRAREYVASYTSAKDRKVYFVLVPE